MLLSEAEIISQQVPTLSMFTLQTKTPRFVRVQSMKLGIIIRFSQVAVIVYVFAYSIWYEGGYQVGMINDR